MKITRWLFLAAASLAGGALAIGYGSSDRAWLAVLACLIALAWLAGWRTHRFGSAALAGFIALAGLGALIGVAGAWLLLGVAGALAAWDLGHLLHRLHTAAQVEDQNRFIAAHLRRLGAVIGIGLAAGWIALGTQFQIDFGWALALAGLAAFSIAQAVRFLQRESG